MDFLKAILGDELFKQVTEKVNAYNGNPENKEKQLKIANLSDGGYVSAAKYQALETEKGNAAEQLKAANDLIEQLKKSGKSNEDLQGKITAYEDQVKNLEKQLTETRIDAAIKVGLMAENAAADVEYLTFKLKEKGETFELDEQGNIKGWNDKIAALKTQLPQHFQNKGKDGYDGFHPMGKDNQQQNNGMTKAELLKKPYREQVKFYQENPEAYAELMKS